MASKPKRKVAATAPVTWRDGIHLTNTSIWCDAVRARDICFLSRASAMRGARHAQLIASQASLNLIGDAGQVGSRLAVPFGQPFSLGAHRIELFSSGHSLGAASLLVTVDARKVVYAGTINPRGSTLGGPLDHRPADILVLSARYGEPHFVFPDPADELSRLVDRCAEVLDGGGVAVVLVGDAGKAMDLGSELLSAGLRVQAHRAFFDAAKRGAQGALSSLRRWNSEADGGRVVLWPIRTRSKLHRDALPTGSAVFLVSGAALAPANVEASGAQEGFVVSNGPDHGELVRYIQSSGASQVYLTGCRDRGRGLSQALPRIRIEALGPPEQLNLFAA